MKKVLVFLIAILGLMGCGQPGFGDIEKGTVDSQLVDIVSQAKELATQYNAVEFVERIELIDIIYEDNKLAAGFGFDGDANLGMTYTTTENNRVVIISNKVKELSETSQLIVVLHELGHAVSEDCSEEQHINDFVELPELMPLSIMNGIDILSVADFWEKYQNFYLRTFFGLRLDRTWK